MAFLLPEPEELVCVFDEDDDGLDDDTKGDSGRVW
jgi:hypothetical protein